MSTGAPSTDLMQIDDQLTDEERLIRDSVRAFVGDRALPYIADWFEAGLLPRDIMPELGKLGVLGMHLTGYGCAGAGRSPTAWRAASSRRATRACAARRPSRARCPCTRSGATGPRSRRPSGCPGWRPERRSAASASPSPITAPTRGHADIRPAGWIGLGALRDQDVDHQRQHRRYRRGLGQHPEGIRGFLVPRGTPASPPGTSQEAFAARLHHVRTAPGRGPVAAAAMLPGVSGLKGPLSCLTEARFGIAWGVTGAARNCLESAIDYARTREQFGKPIASFQLTQAKLSWMATDLYRSQLLALHVGRLKEAGSVTPVQVSIAKMTNVRSAIDIARQARTVLGASGVTLEYPPIRHANNLEAVLTYEGTEEIHTLAIGQALTGISAYR